MSSDDATFIAKTIELARQCNHEHGSRDPFVAAIVVRDGEILQEAFRGEVAAGQHAEYIALDVKPDASEIYAGATLYTVLEPCTERGFTSDGTKKVECVQRVIDRRLARVVIGMLDPNPKVHGRGIRRLREAGIEVALFDSTAGAQVEDLNREFSRHWETTTRSSVAGVEQRVPGRSLDEWYTAVNTIFYQRNILRKPEEVFVHLVEVMGGVSLLASNKKKVEHPEHFIPKAIAWLMALCGRLGIRSISAMLWRKFPAHCPYCQQSPHKEPACKVAKRQPNQPDWDALQKLGQTRTTPVSLSDWQKMFGEIYPTNQTEEYAATFARFTEELGELAEAIRVFPIAPGYFLSEASDVFAWLMHLQNLIEDKTEIPSDERHTILEREFQKAYPDRCRDCGSPVCTCRAVLDSTLGRIAHELGGADRTESLFVGAQELAKMFQRNTK